eukprot:5947518-Amphidinium_carterae.1
MANPADERSTVSSNVPISVATSTNISNTGTLTDYWYVTPEGIVRTTATAVNMFRRGSPSLTISCRYQPLHPYSEKRLSRRPRLDKTC